MCVCVYALLVLFDGKCLKRQRYSPALSFPPFYISVIVITVAATAAPWTNKPYTNADREYKRLASILHNSQSIHRIRCHTSFGCFYDFPRNWPVQHTMIAKTISNGLEYHMVYQIFTRFYTFIDDTFMVNNNCILL